MVKNVVKLMVQAGGVIGVVALCLIWPSRHWSGGAGVTAMLLAGFVCLAGALCSLIPVVIAVERKAGWLIYACLGGTAIRLLVTALAGFIVYLTVLQRAHMTVFSLSLVAFYLSLLIWETLLSVRFIKIVYPGSV